MKKIYRNRLRETVNNNTILTAELTILDNKGLAQKRQ